eukprot:2535060-Rhodomonas_salina.3
MDSIPFRPQDRRRLRVRGADMLQIPAGAVHHAQHLVEQLGFLQGMQSCTRASALSKARLSGDYVHPEAREPGSVTVALVAEGTTASHFATSSSGRLAARLCAATCLSEFT